MSIESRLKEDMKTSMREKDKLRLMTIRMALAEIKKCQIDGKETVTEEAALAIIEKMIKQRKDAAAQFDSAGRDELADQERLELGYLQVYLPEPLSEEELNALLESAVSEVGAQSMQDMGKVMALIKPKAQGRCDFGQLSQKVKARLSA